jgi:hypothetical protein
MIKPLKLIRKRIRLGLVAGFVIKDRRWCRGPVRSELWFAFISNPIEPFHLTRLWTQCGATQIVLTGRFTQTWVQMGLRQQHVNTTRTMSAQHRREALPACTAA